MLKEKLSRIIKDYNCLHYAPQIHCKRHQWLCKTNQLFAVRKNLQKKIGKGIIGTL